MKKKNILKVFGFALMLLSLTACNKVEDFTKATSVEIMGYNVGTTELEVSIDELNYEKFRIKPNSLLNFSKVYTYSSNKNEALLRIKDISSKKELFQQTWTLNHEQSVFFPFVNINGTPLEIKLPKADPSTNKMAFYIYYPQSNDAIDVFLKKDDGTINYVAKNVKPDGWVYADYLTDEAFKAINDGSTNFKICFTKAGTTDQWAFKNSEFMSQYSVGFRNFPRFGAKGLVCAYFVTTGTNQMELVRLFKSMK